MRPEKDINMLLGHRESTEFTELLNALVTWIQRRSDGLSPQERERLHAELAGRLAAIEASRAQGDERESVQHLRALLIELGALSGTRSPSSVHGTDVTRGEVMGNSRSVGQGGRLSALIDSLRPRAKAAPLFTYPTVRLPSSVREKTVFFLEVGASAQSSLDGGSKISLARKSDQEAVDLDISVELPSSEGVYARSVKEAVLRICPDGRAAQIVFELYAMTAGQHSVVVVFRRDGLELTRVTRAITVTASSEAQASAAPVTFVAAGLSAGSRYSGLVLRVQEQGQSGDQQIVELSLSGPAWTGPPLQGQVSLPSNSQVLLASLCRNMEKTLKIADLRAREQSMQGIGAELARTILPLAIRNELLRPRWKEGTPLHIELNDAWIPWEALFLGELSGMRGGQPGYFLGEHFAVTRWLRVGSAREQVGGGNAVMIAPTNSGLSVGQERSVLHEVTGQPPLDLMELADVQQCLRGTPRAQVLHFACHGQSKADQVIGESLHMQDGELHATDIPITDPGTAGELDGALVFLNACQAGIEQRGLWQHNGWASKFLHAGVGAVVAPSWTVTDEGALGFASHFYRYAKHGLALSEAARLARRQIGRTGNLDRIGYAVYATPMAVAVFAAPDASSSPGS